MYSIRDVRNSLLNKTWLFKSDLSLVTVYSIYKILKGELRSKTSVTNFFRKFLFYVSKLFVNHTNLSLIFYLVHRAF